MRVAINYPKEKPTSKHYLNDLFIMTNILMKTLLIFHRDYYFLNQYLNNISNYLLIIMIDIYI